MKIEHRIENVNVWFTIDKNKIYYQSNNDILCYDINSKKHLKIASIQTDFSGICKNFESIVLINTYGYQVLNSNNKFEKFQERRIGTYDLLSSKYIISKVAKSRTEWHMELENVYTQEILWKTDERENLKNVDGKFYSFTISDIKKRNNKTGEPIWNYKCNEVGFQPLNLVANDKYLLLCLPQSDLLICLDNSNGNELWKRTSISKGILIDNKKDYAHQIMINYGRFDLNNGEIIHSKIDRDYFSKVKIENQKSNLLQFGNYLIVNDSKSRRTGALNLESLTFDKWIDGIYIPEGYIMKTDNHYLFLHGSDMTLNIISIND